MALQCPECRTVTANLRSPQCEACGYRFTGTETKNPAGTFAQYVTAAIAVGIVMGVFLALRGC
jgi:uncharacterized protein (DUF983 family)